MSDYWICLWVSDVLSLFDLGILISRFQLVYSLFDLVVLFVWCLREIFICEFQICPLKRDKFEIQRLSATLYLLLQAVTDSMTVAVAFPDFSGFLAFRAPNIGFPKSGSNGSFSRADIPRTDVDPRNMSSRTLVLVEVDPVGRIWFCPQFRSSSWFWISVLFLTLTSSM